MFKNFNTNKNIVRENKKQNSRRQELMISSLNLSVGKTNGLSLSRILANKASLFSSMILF